MTNKTKIRINNKGDRAMQINHRTDDSEKI